MFSLAARHTPCRQCSLNPLLFGFDYLLKCSLCYTSDENRYCMEYLARLMRLAINHHVCSYDDLYTTETQVIQKLISHSLTKELYENYTHFHKVLRSSFPQTGYLKVNAKKRYINFRMTIFE